MKPVVLCILDGWGIVQPHQLPGINLPFWDELLATCPQTTLEASGAEVGLPDGQMGNSEVGHMAIGSGRVLYQDLPRIDHALSTNALDTNPVFQNFIEHTKKNPQGICHLLGLASPGGVHAHHHHLIYMAQRLNTAGIRTVCHLFLDGRDTPPCSARPFIEDIMASGALIGSLMGRYYGMDRDQRWDRTQKALDAIVHAKAPVFKDPLSFLNDCYAQNITDEFVLPHIALDFSGIQPGDSLFMTNFRADRVRQLLSALVLPDDQLGSYAPSVDRRGFTPHYNAVLGMAPYSEQLTPYVPVLFPKVDVTDTLGEVISQQSGTQLRIAETEKYAHVTFFFSGGREALFPGETRHLISSPQVSTYDLAPEMSALDITTFLEHNIERFDLIVVNYANPDMVGHTGHPDAVKAALETVDGCLKKLLNACQKTGHVLVITADHGNAEQLIDPETYGPHTAHTCNPVPFLIANACATTLRSGGALCDVAPTILEIMGLPQPHSMTGQSLLQHTERQAHD